MTAEAVMRGHQYVCIRNRYPKLTAKLDIHGSVVKFEIDTGAEVSTIPAKSTDKG